MADLEDLGLSSYEARAYRSLIDRGPTSAQNLARLSGVPEGRIYDVLEGLESWGLVRVQTDSRPKQYLAVEPEIAINRLIEKRTSELESEIHRFELAGQELIETLPSPTKGESTFQTTAIGVEEATELLFERIEAADDQIVMVAEHFTPEIDIHELGPDALDKFGTALDRGVEISVLASESVVETIPTDFLTKLGNEPFTSEKFEARITETLYGTFYLIDHTEICFEIQNPMEREKVVGLIYLQDPTLAVELETQLTDYWKQADPFEPSRL